MGSGHPRGTFFIEHCTDDLWAALSSFSQKNNLGKKGKPGGEGGGSEGGLSKGHNFSVFFLDPFPNLVLFIFSQ